MSRVQTPHSGTHGREVSAPEAFGPPPPASQNWYALRVRSRFEFIVRDELRTADIPEFLPTRVTETRWSDRTRTSSTPLFAGYIFACFDPAARCEVLSVRGVISILSLDLKPVPIPDGVIADLRRVVDSPAPAACCPYVAGVAVRVERGPFAGCAGVITRVKNQTVLSIPVRILGRAVSVQIDAADVSELKTGG